MSAPSAKSEVVAPTVFPPRESAILVRRETQTTRPPQGSEGSGSGNKEFTTIRSNASERSLKGPGSVSKMRLTELGSLSGRSGDEHDAANIEHHSNQTNRPRFINP